MDSAVLLASNIIYKLLQFKYACVAIVVAVVVVVVIIIVVILINFIIG